MELIVVRMKKETSKLGMRLDIKILSLYLISSLFISCNFSKKPSNDSQTIAVNIDEEKELNYSQLINSLEYLQLKIPKGEIVGNIGKVFFTEGYIGLIDRRKRSIWIFTDQGDYVNEIPVIIGQGPGEVLTFSDADFGEKDQIHVLGAYRINTFNLKGELLNEVQLPLLIRSFKYIDGQNSFIAFMNNEMATPKGDLSKGLYNLYTFDKEGKIIERFLPFEQEKADLSRLLISNFYSFEGKLHHYSFLDNQIYQIINPKKIKVKYTLDFGNKKIPEELFQKKSEYETGLKFLYEEVYKEDFLLINAVMETSKYLMVGINYSEESSYLIFDKTNQETTVVESSNFYNDFLPGLDVYFHLSYKGNIYGVKPVAEVLDRIRAQSNYKNSNLNKIADSLSLNEGPVLIKAKLK